ncbi:hypothetical protein B0H11DRAFT_1643801, partial [Mycena galericulata]
VLLSVGYIIQAIALAALIYANPLYWKQPYHTSALTGDAWVFELMSGHPERIHSELGMHLHVFLIFVA